MNDVAKRIAYMANDPFYFIKYAMRTYDSADPTCIEPKPFCASKTYVEDLVNIWKYSEKTYRNMAIEKSRQMRVSWLLGGLHLHYAFTNNYRNCLVLSKKEVDAIALLDRLEFIYKNIPEEVWPAALRPKYDRVKTELVFFDKKNTKTRKFESKIISLTSSPDAPRSYTASRIWLDEFCFMEGAEQIYSSASGSASGAGVGYGIPITLSSTNPVLRNQSDHLMWRIRDDRLSGQVSSSPEELPFELKTQKGLDAKINGGNKYISIGLHYSADPDRDPATPTGRKWFERERPQWADKDWNTEFEMSRETYSGSGVYSIDYNDRIHTFNENEFTVDPHEPILLGWDWGGNHSVTLCQYIDQRLHVFCEMNDIGWNTRQVAPLVLEYLKDNYPNQPYIHIPDPTGFDRGRQDGEGRSNVEVLSEICEEYGITPIVKNLGKKNNWEKPRVDAVLRLLKENVGGQPRLQLIEAAKTLRMGMRGSYQYDDNIKAQKAKSKIVKNEFSHIMNALEYVAVFVTSKSGENFLDRGDVYRKLLKRYEKQETRTSKRPAYKL